MKTHQVRVINEPEFEAEVLHSVQPVLVGFLAGWSQPCRLIEPVLEEIADTCKGKARVFRVSVEDNPELGMCYGIQSIPAVLYFMNGDVAAKIVGAASAKAILGKLQALTVEKPAMKESERRQNK
jgi:thioredoxin 1